MADPATEPEVSVPGYKPCGVISAGKVATLYDVEEEKTGRRLALKLFRPIKSSQTRYKRFNLEAELLATLDHPGIARLHTTGAVPGKGGDCFFHVFDLVEGRALPDYVRENDLLTRERLELLIRICDIVDYIHSKGVLHRNLKPDNILVEKGGNPRLIDFGLARIKSGEQKITAPGQIIGTLTYMAPEQARGKSEDLDERVDVYSLGGVGYTLLARRPPQDLEGMNLLAALNTVQSTDVIPLGQIDPSFGGELERIFLKALAREPSERYGSVWAFSADLRQYLDKTGG